MFVTLNSVFPIVHVLQVIYQHFCDNNSQYHDRVEVEQSINRSVVYIPLFLELWITIIWFVDYN